MKELMEADMYRYYRGLHFLHNYSTVSGGTVGHKLVREEILKRFAGTLCDDVKMLEDECKTIAELTHAKHPNTKEVSVCLVPKNPPYRSSTILYVDEESVLLCEEIENAWLNPAGRFWDKHVKGGQG